MLLNCFHYHIRLSMHRVPCSLLIRTSYSSFDPFLISLHLNVFAIFVFLVRNRTTPSCTASLLTWHLASTKSFWTNRSASCSKRFPAHFEISHCALDFFSLGWYQLDQLLGSGYSWLTPTPSFFFFFLLPFSVGLSSAWVVSRKACV